MKRSCTTVLQRLLFDLVLKTFPQVLEFAETIALVYFVITALDASVVSASDPIPSSVQNVDLGQSKSTDHSTDNATVDSDADEDYVPEPPYVRGSIGFEADGYRYAPPNSTAEVYPILMGRSHGRFEKGYFEAYESAEGMVMSPISEESSPEPYFEAPELFIATSPKLENFKVILGRRLEEWNHLDEEWKLGIWQPRYRWDYLRPDTVALTGLTIEAEQPLFKAVLFGSYIYIPERGVPVGTQNGQLISSSPWFIAPPNHIQILSQNTPLNYDLQTPSINSMIFHPSASGMIRIGDRTGPWFSGAYAYKPMNQLLLAFDGHLLLSGQGQDVADVPVVPRVVYHHLISAEGGFSSDTVNFWVSVLKDQPGPEVTPPLGGTYTLQEVSPSTAISPTLQITVVDPDENRMKVGFSYLHQQGGNASSQSSDAEIPGSTSVFEERYPFQEAFKISGELEMPGLAESLVGWSGDTILSSSVLYDIENRGAIFTVDAKYRPTPRWEGGIGMDLLGSQDAAQAANQPPDDFIGRYQGEDRLRVGVTYVF